MEPVAGRGGPTTAQRGVRHRVLAAVMTLPPLPPNHFEEFPMNKTSTALMFACLTIAAGTASAAEVMKHDDAMMKKDMTMQHCKDHITMSKKDGMKKDDATMKMDTLCKDMMAKDQLNVKKPGDQEAPAKK